MKTVYLGLLILVCSISIHAQQSTYAGEEQRVIKSLSEKEIEQYRSGAGMGLAKAAELNHYPGPKHVLQFADTLQLSSETKKKFELLVESMSDAAIDLGKQIVEKEQILNNAFAEETITTAQLEKMTSEIGILQAKLRFVHLRTHVTTKSLLTKHQIYLYDILRGYTSGKMNDHQGHQ